MKVRAAAIWILVILSIRTAVPARGAPGPGLGPSRNDFVARFLSAAARSPWPGYRPDSQPFLIEFDRENEGASVLVSAAAVPEGFNPVPGLDAPSRRVLWRGGTSHTSDRSMKAVPGAPYPRDIKRFRIQDGKESDTALGVMLHELFHIHQDETFSETFAADAVPYEDAESLASLYVEHLLLSRALIAGDDWREAAKDFAVLRQERRRRRPLTAGIEDYQERYEGTAKYFELSGVPHGQGAATRACMAIRDLMFNLRDNHRSHRARYYASGAAMGLLLDRAEMDWKPRVAGGTALFSLLLEALPMSKVEYSDRSRRIRTSHRLAFLSKEAGHLLREESEQRLKIRDAFMRLGRWTVALTAPPGTAITDHVGVDFPRANFDDGTEIAFVEFFSIRAGPNLELDLNQTDIMESLHVYARSKKNQSSAIRFPLDSGGAIKIDGSPWTPADAAAEFGSLEIKDAHSHLLIRSPGRLRVRGRDISVDWRGR